MTPQRAAQEPAQHCGHPLRQAGAHRGCREDGVAEDAPWPAVSWCITQVSADPWCRDLARETCSVCPRDVVLMGLPFLVVAWREAKPSPCRERPRPSPVRHRDVTSSGHRDLLGGLKAEGPCRSCQHLPPGHPSPPHVLSGDPGDWGCCELLCSLSSLWDLVCPLRAARGCCFTVGLGPALGMHLPWTCCAPSPARPAEARAPGKVLQGSAKQPPGSL